MSKHKGKILIATLFLSLFVIFNSGCNKILNSSNQYFKISTLFKDYAFFDSGSKWIYQNDSTKAVDTLKVKDVKSYIGFQPIISNQPAYSFEAIELIYDTNYFNMVKSVIFAGPSLAGSNQPMNSKYRIFFQNGNYVLAFAPGYPMGIEQRIGGMEGLYTNVEVISSMVLNGKTYSNVYHTMEKTTFNVNTTDTTTLNFFFAPHAGLIKWTVKNTNKTTVYSMIDSKLKQ